VTSFPDQTLAALLDQAAARQPAPGGRTVAEAPLYTEELVTADVGLADVANRRHEMPLLGNPRLDFLLLELGRLTTNREEAGVPGSPPRLGS
jgi:hypothetical protein